MTDQDKNLFNNDDQSSVTNNQQTSPAPDQLLASIVDADGKPKYTSVETALKALQASQEHIKRIEAENAEYRDKVTKAATMEDILTAIKPGKVATEDVAPKKTESVDIAKLVEDTITARERKQTESVNIQAVTSKLKELYGDKASETFYSKAAELGVSKAVINDLASKSPSAVFKLLGLDAKKAPTKTPSGIRTDALDLSKNDTVTRSAMSHGSSKDLVSAWRKSQERTNKKLGLEG